MHLSLESNGTLSTHSTHLLIDNEPIKEPVVFVLIHFFLQIIATKKDASNGSARVFGKEFGENHSEAVIFLENCNVMLLPRRLEEILKLTLIGSCMEVAFDHLLRPRVLALISLVDRDGVPIIVYPRASDSDLPLPPVLPHLELQAWTTAKLLRTRFLESSPK
jgi:hypothetical protein